MKTTTKLLLAALLLLLPFAARGLWFYRGVYRPPALPDLEALQISLPQAEYEPVADTPTQGNGRVAIDLTHSNNLQIDDLTPLRDRLTARGLEVIPLTDVALFASTLRGATALLEIAPVYPFDSSERSAVQSFVEDGGKLLIIGDPTRPVPPPPDALIDLTAIFFPESAVPILNNLSSLFGITYTDDYLYNLETNEGNYRNVRFTEFDPDSPLTGGIDSLVLFATYSIRGGVPLITGDDQTFSNKRTGETGLAPAVFAADGNVLALGDLTMLTAPYHTVAGNDRFLSNLAGWLGEDGRDWDLADFPYLFDDTVEFAQLKQGDFDPRLLVFGSTLQSNLDQAGLALTASNVLSPTQDTVFAGTYLEHEALSGILHSAGVTVTLTFSNTGESDTPTLDTLEEGKLDIGGLGTLDVHGTTLYVEHPVAEDEVAVVVLVYDESGLVTALDNLINGFPSGCLVLDALIVCSTGEVNEPSSGGSGGSEDDLGAPPPGEGGNVPPADAPRIFILAMDTGPDGVLTSVYDLQSYLGATYNVTVWSLALDGPPAAENVTGYDLVIVDSGDYSFDFETFDALNTLDGMDSTPTWFVGAQPLFALETEPLVDVEAADFSHPILAGLENASFALGDSLSGVPEQLFRPEDLDFSSGNGAVILARGPGNATPGGPVLFAADDGTAPRAVIAALPWYRLPLDVQETLALNVVAWLLGGG